VPARQVPLPAITWLTGTAVAAGVCAGLGRGPLLGDAATPVAGQLGALALAVGVVVLLTAVSASGALRRLPWIVALLVGYLAAAVFPLVLGLAEVDRGSDVGRPTDGYVREADRVDGEPVRYLRHLADRQRSAPESADTEAALTHAPARTLVVATLGHSRTGAAVALALLGALAVPLLAIAVRSFAGEDPARDLLLVLATLPAGALAWGATDAVPAVLAAGALAWGVTGAARKRGLVSAAGAGVVLGTLAVADYGLVWGVAAALACTYFARRRPLLNLVTGVTALIPLALFNHAGFNWPDGVSAAREAMSGRPWQAWVVPSFVALAIVAGPAVVGAAASLRRTAGWPLLIGGAVAVLASLFLGLARGGAERSWWPAALLLVTASTATPFDREHTSWLVGLSGLTAVVLAAVVVPTWLVG
jgi:hypothetical protein